MSILVYTETENGKFKKNAFEAVSYAKSIADQAGESVTAFAINPDDATELYKYGAQKVLVAKGDAHKISPEVLGKLVAEQADGNLVILSHSNAGASISPFLAFHLKDGLITNAFETPQSLSPLKVNRKSFSGKGIMLAETGTDKKVITVAPNSFGLKINAVEGNIEEINVDFSGGKITVENVETSSGKLDLKEAENVVSAGRGLKGEENWGMVEELAELLGAATACSKPVSDMGWRPHSEHVGQTGKAIAPNLYIAIGISGAIQHLAGVNSSKNIVVINNDPDAPFFKSADYGIVGDAFEVLPKLIESIKKYKNS